MIEENKQYSEEQNDQWYSFSDSQQQQKKAEYKLMPICRFKGQCFDAFFLLGEIFVDLSQKTKSIEDKTSFWNQCKQWSRGVINYDQRLLIISIDNKIKPFEDIDKFKKRYMEYPDQTIHSLFQVIECYLPIQRQVQLLQKQYCLSLKVNDSLQNQLFVRRILFDQCITQYLGTLRKDLVYIGSCIGPDLEKECFLGYNNIISESMCILLGKSLSQMQEVYQRNGGYNYLDYESNMEITKRVIKNLLINIYKVQNLPDYMLEESDNTFELKFITYDEITFYAQVSLQILSIRDFVPGYDPKQLADHCIALLFIDISPITLQQIITIRQENNSYEVPEDSLHNLEYTLFAEIFKDKMGKLSFKSQKQNNSQ